MTEEKHRHAGGEDTEVALPARAAPPGDLAPMDGGVPIGNLPRRRSKHAGLLPSFVLPSSWVVVVVAAIKSPLLAIDARQYCRARARWMRRRASALCRRGAPPPLRSGTLCVPSTAAVVRRGRRNEVPQSRSDSSFVVWYMLARRKSGGSLLSS